MRIQELLHINLINGSTEFWIQLPERKHRLKLLHWTQCWTKIFKHLLVFPYRLRCLRRIVYKLIRFQPQFFLFNAWRRIRLLYPQLLYIRKLSVTQLELAQQPLLLTIASVKSTLLLIVIRIHIGNIVEIMNFKSFFKSLLAYPIPQEVQEVLQEQFDEQDELDFEN